LIVELMSLATRMLLLTDVSDKFNLAQLMPGDHQAIVNLLKRMETDLLTVSRFASGIVDNCRRISNVLRKAGEPSAAFFGSPAQTEALKRAVASCERRELLKALGECKWRVVKQLPLTQRYLQAALARLAVCKRESASPVQSLIALAAQVEPALQQALEEVVRLREEYRAHLPLAIPEVDPTAESRVAVAVVARGVPSPYTGNPVEYHIQDAGLCERAFGNSGRNHRQGEGGNPVWGSRELGMWIAAATPHDGDVKVVVNHGAATKPGGIGVCGMDGLVREWLEPDKFGEYLRTLDEANFESGSQTLVVPIICHSLEVVNQTVGEMTQAGYSLRCVGLIVVVESSVFACVPQWNGGDKFSYVGSTECLQLIRAAEAANADRQKCVIDCLAQVNIRGSRCGTLCYIGPKDVGLAPMFPFVGPVGPLGPTRVDESFIHETGLLPAPAVENGDGTLELLRFKLGMTAEFDRQSSMMPFCREPAAPEIDAALFRVPPGLRRSPKKVLLAVAEKLGFNAERAKALLRPEMVGPRPKRSLMEQFLNMFQGVDLGGIYSNFVEAFQTLLVEYGAAANDQLYRVLSDGAADLCF
jgi:hypothetical protein